MSTSPRRFAWPKLDKFTLMLVATVTLASLLPARGGFVPVVDVIGKASIILLFFLHGANLSSEAVKTALGQWKLQLLMLAATFVLFPVIGLAMAPLSGRAIDPTFYTGLLFLCCLPSTVQSSIALTSIARGNVPAAICAASASNLFGILLTPLLTGLLLANQSAISFDAVWSIVSTILLPFAAGQLLHKRIGGWLKSKKPFFSVVDRGSVLIMVYSAFGKAVVGGIWQTVSAVDLFVLILFCIGLLLIVVFALRLAARLSGLSQPDEAALVFCGSVKSLITGVPMASVLFPAAMVGAIVLPLMIFHQTQLIICAFLARGYERRAS